MVLDTSALIAILFDEPERTRLEAAIDKDPFRLLSAMNRFEAGMVMIGRLGPTSVDRLDRMLDTLSIVVVPFDDHHAMIARNAFARFGKGRHPAGLNFGDCAAYALAIAEAEPLLFKGTDFAATDVLMVDYGHQG